MVIHALAAPAEVVEANGAIPSSSDQGTPLLTPTAIT